MADISEVMALAKAREAAATGGKKRRRPAPSGAGTSRAKRSRADPPPVRRRVATPPPVSEAEPEPEPVPVSEVPPPRHRAPSGSTATGETFRPRWSVRTGDTVTNPSVACDMAKHLATPRDKGVLEAKAPTDLMTSLVQGAVQVATYSGLLAKSFARLDEQQQLAEAKLNRAAEDIAALTSQVESTKERAVMREQELEDEIAQLKASMKKEREDWVASKAQDIAAARAEGVEEARRTMFETEEGKDAVTAEGFYCFRAGVWNCRQHLKSIGADVSLLDEVCLPLVGSEDHPLDREAQLAAYRELKKQRAAPPPDDEDEEESGSFIVSDEEDVDIISSFQPAIGQSVSSSAGGGPSEEIPSSSPAPDPPGSVDDFAPDPEPASAPIGDLAPDPELVPDDRARDDAPAS